MDLRIIAVGKSQPEWVGTSIKDYQKRFPSHLSLELTEISATKRGKGLNSARATIEEGKKILEAIPKGSFVIAMERTGDWMNSRQLSGLVERQMQEGGDMVFLIGGPEGLAETCLEKADKTLSLSAMTMAHGIARVVLVEQLYRAWTILSGHPYHR